MMIRNLPKLRLPSPSSRWQRGQAINEYWPILGTVAGVALVVLAVWLSPGLNKLYHRIVDALFGLDDTPSVSECVSPDETNYPKSTSAGAHDFELSSWVYNENDDTTTVAYTVNSGESPAISHWVLETPDCLTNAEIKSASETYEIVNPDPKTGATGIKFEEEYQDNEMRVVYITFYGKVNEQEGSITTKASDNIDSGTVQIPGCTGAPPDGGGEEGSSEVCD